MPPSSTRKSCTDDSRMAARSCCLIMGSSARPLRSGTWLSGPTCPPAEHRCIRRISTREWYLFAFQSWCPGCHSQGFPALVETISSAVDSSVAFVAVQTVFEGFDVNTAQAAQRAAVRYSLDIPVGHDIGPNGEPSPLMRNYRKAGLPGSCSLTLTVRSGSGSPCRRPIRRKPSTR